MLHEYLGEEDFKTGIQNYIQVITIFAKVLLCENVLRIV